jgi:hypothetical protein
MMDIPSTELYSSNDLHRGLLLSGSTLTVTSSWTGIINKDDVPLVSFGIPVKICDSVSLGAACRPCDQDEFRLESVAAN